jgi:predicted ATPase
VSDATPDTSPAPWRIELLGQVRASRGSQVITRFGGRKITALLGRLALHPRRQASREELVDLLWPDADLTTGRNRLRQVLFALRQLLEPPGAPPVLQVDHVGVALLPGAVRCDVAEFEACVHARDWAQARQLYVGELMPGHYEGWIDDERQRLAELAERVEAQVLSALASAPSPEPASLPSSTLPCYLTPFFGRELELAGLSQGLQSHRLFTLTGPGGTGKTRLAAELARREQAHFDTVAFVALADCRRGDELPTRLRTALQLPPGADDVLGQVGLRLQGRRALLVLDNFEQLVAEGGVPVVAQLLGQLLGLHLLLSSRRRLGLAGERCHEVLPLPLPADDDDLATLAANPAVALFVDRAQAARAGLRLEGHNRADVLALCTALQGVPLALELAASRAHTLSFADMRRQLEARLGTSPRPSAPTTREPSALARHASLDAALQWSWQLLTRPQQRALAALSVFREGFTADAAAAVWAERDASEMLARLVGDSLVRAEPGTDGPMRHQLYEMVREFAAGQLAADGQPRQVLTLSLATAGHWERRGTGPELRRLWLAALQALPGQSTDGPAEPDLELHAARCLFARRLYDAGDTEAARQLADDAVAQAGADRERLAQALAVQLRLRWKSQPRHDDGLSAALRGALELTHPEGDRRTRAELLNLLGEVMVQGQQDAEAALTFYDEARALYEALGEVRQAWDVRLGQGICAQVQGRYDDAVALHGAVARAAERLDDPLLLIDACNNLAVVCTLARRWEDAVHHGRRQLQLATRRYSRYMQLMALWNLARPLVRSAQAEQATQVLACCVREWQAHYAPLTPRDWRYVRTVRRLSERLRGTVPTELAWAEGQGLSLTEAVALALRG